MAVLPPVCIVACNDNMGFSLFIHIILTMFNHCRGITVIPLPPPQINDGTRDGADKESDPKPKKKVRLMSLDAFRGWVVSHTVCVCE